MTEEDRKIIDLVNERRQLFYAKLMGDRSAGDRITQISREIELINYHRGAAVARQRFEESKRK